LDEAEAQEADVEPEIPRPRGVRAGFPLSGRAAAGGAWA